MARDGSAERKRRGERQISAKGVLRRRSGQRGLKSECHVGVCETERESRSLRSSLLSYNAGAGMKE